MGRSGRDPTAAVTRPSTTLVKPETDQVYQPDEPPSSAPWAALRYGARTSRTSAYTCHSSRSIATSGGSSKVCRNPSGLAAVTVRPASSTCSRSLEPRGTAHVTTKTCGVSLRPVPRRNARGAYRWPFGSPRPVEAAVRLAQGADVARSLVGRLVGAGRHCEHSAQLVDSSESLAFHPVRQAVEEHGCMLGAVPQQRGGGHHDVGAGEEVLGHVGRGLDTSGRGERGPHTSVEERDPCAGQPGLGRAGEADLAHDGKLIGVDIGLQEAVEEHERVRARLVEP